MIAEEGVVEAFSIFAAEDAVINRGNKLIKTKANIKSYIKSQPFTHIKLKSIPDFVDVARSGDLGYTYGQLYFSAIDTAGNVVTFNALFLTVWKRQKDGLWRFVWN